MEITETDPLFSKQIPSTMFSSMSFITSLFSTISALEYRYLYCAFFSSPVNGSMFPNEVSRTPFILNVSLEASPSTRMQGLFTEKIMAGSLKFADSITIKGVLLR